MPTTTTNPSITGNWAEVASGPMQCTVSSRDRVSEYQHTHGSVQYLISSTTPAPDMFGHPIPGAGNISLRLVATEKLYVRGPSDMKLILTTSDLQ